MKLTRVAQAYLGLISVFTLAMAGVGTYVWQSGQATSSADVTSTPSQLVFDLILEKEKIKVGEEMNLTLTGDFTDEPITEATVLISFPSDLIEVTGIQTSDGMLGEATSEVVKDNLISLAFFPKTGVAEVGNIGVIKIKAKQSGEPTFSILTESPNNEFLPTTVSTLSQSAEDIIVFDNSLIIE